MAKRTKNEIQVASVAAFNPEGKLLFGKRRDNGKYTLPGGHLMENEHPLKGAVRELLEETDLSPEKLQALGSEVIPKGKRWIKVHAYRAEVRGTPSADRDPDEEIVEFRWVDPEKIPEDILDNLHSKKNVTLRLLGLQEYSFDDELSKAEPLEKMALIHNDATKPKVVYRLQNEAGEGPYGVTVFGGNPAKRTGGFEYHNKVVSALDSVFRNSSGNQPEPDIDFNTREFKAMQRGHLYGFESPSHAEEWFGSKGLSDLKELGFKLKPIPAQRIYRSKSGKQVLFLPARTSMTKMALKDVRVGLKVPQRSVDGGKAYSYDHLLPKVEKQNGLTLTLFHDPILNYGTHDLHVSIRHNGVSIGYVKGAVEGRHFHIEEGNIYAEKRAQYTGRGLGKAAYEALLSHAKNVHGCDTVYGDEHSTSAMGVHMSLARKHGLNYKPKSNRFAASHEGPFDARFSPYQYALKSEDLAKGAMQRLVPFDPKKNRPESEAEMAVWQVGHGYDDDIRDARENISYEYGPARKRFLHKLSGVTQIRKHPKTGEREFLLHRGMGSEEYDAAINGAGSWSRKEGEPERINHDHNTSWTPDSDIAQGFTDPGGPRVVSAWVPESRIMTIPKQYGSLNEMGRKGPLEPSPPGPNTNSEEHEVIVGPNHNSQLATPEEVDPLKIVHGRINDAGEGTFLRDRFRRAGLIKSGDLEKGVAQRLWPFNPSEDVNPKIVESVKRWQAGGMSQERDRLGIWNTMPATGLSRALHRLHGLTQVRRNPNTGEREFLLHRGMDEHEYQHSVGSRGLAVHSNSSSSWTPHLQVAKGFVPQGAGEFYGNVVSAWIPEKRISTVPNQLFGGGDPNFREEHEVIVSPHTSEIYKGSGLGKSEYYIEHRPYQGEALRIPVSGTPARTIWDQKYAGLQAERFAGGQPERLREISVPVANIQTTNQPVNKSRLKLYQRMLAAGDTLPPVVVHPRGNGYALHDGNHRLAAAVAAGHKYINAVEILPPLEKMAVADGYILKSEAVDKMIEHPLRAERLMALKLPGVEEKHLLQGLDDQDHGIAEAVLQHPGVNARVLAAALGHPRPEIRIQALAHPLIDTTHLDQALEDKDDGVLEQVVQHPHLREEQIRKLVDSKAPLYIKALAVKRPDVLDLSPEDSMSLMEKIWIEAQKEPGGIFGFKKNISEWLRSRDMGDLQKKSAWDWEGKWPRVYAKYPIWGPYSVGNKIAAAWQIGSQDQKSRDSLASIADPSYRDYAIDYLHRLGVPHRVTGPGPLDKEFLLYRGASPEEKRQSILGDTITHKETTSWTPDRGIASNFSYNHGPPGGLYNPKLPEKFAAGKYRAWALPRTIGAWIPASKIAVMPGLHTSRDEGNKIMAKEREVIVHPHTSKLEKIPTMKSEQEDDYNSNLIDDMHGFAPEHHEAFEAAKFLVCGGDLSPGVARRELWREDGNCIRAALRAYGLEPTEKNIKALQAVMKLQNVSKTEVGVDNGVKPPRELLAAVPEAEEVTKSLQRAFKDKEVKPVKLKGKHSRGTLIAIDDNSNSALLIKPGSGKQSPAAGAREDPSTQSQREAAFWHIADKLGLGGSIPRADLVLADGQQWAIIKMLPPNYRSLEKRQEENQALVLYTLNRYRADGTLHRWAVLDGILGNSDRHAQNMMMSSGLNPDIALIDHGSAFAGNNFDPAKDHDSFIPFYLRAWTGKNFNTMDVKEKLAYMPKVGPAVQQDLRRWLDGIHADDLAAIMHRYGINPQPTLDRLAKLKAAAEPVDEAINRFWVTT